MKERKKLLALLLAGTMVAGMTACGGNSGSGNTSTDGDKKSEKTEDGSDSSKSEGGKGSDAPLVIANDDMSEKFCKFFETTVPDKRINDLVVLPLIGNDRSGEIITKGIEGEKKEYNGKEYNYTGLADLTTKENKDGTVSYDFKLRDDVVFSDGEKLTADDVIFSYYVYLDPSYDGASSLNSLPITGLEKYRGGTSTLLALLLEKGEDNKDFKYVTEEQQKKFFETDYPAARKEFINGIVDYVNGKGLTTKNDTVDANDVAKSMASWGYAKVNDNGSITTNYTNKTFTLKDKDVPTEEDFWNEILANPSYEKNVLTATDKEKGTKTFSESLPDEYKNSVVTGESADYVEGIKKVNDYEVEVQLDSVDATAVYQLGIEVEPMHYYGNKDEYDYDAHKFGFKKGDLSSVRSKMTKPLGAGPYVFEKYENKTAYLKANDKYFKGAPKIKEIQFKATTKSDVIPGVVQGTIDIGDPNGTKESIEQIKGENGNNDLNGDKIETVLTDTLGYGYIGMNSQLVKIGDDPASKESKAFRKALATVIAVYRDVTIDSYYGEAASVINYPISNTSWAAPQASDSDYEIAFSKDVDGNPIYKEGMSEDEKYKAALKASLGFFEAAGFKVKDGKLVEAPKGAKLSLEATIPGNGSGDHPSFGILTAASEAFKEIGFDFKINDLSDSTVLWNGLESGTVPMWCAAWGASIDPDMFQIYHSKGGSAKHYRIYQKELDDMIMDARTNLDQTYRKAVYKECLDYIVDYAVEIPVYQRQDVYIFSSERIKTDTICPDQTTFYSFYNEIETMEMK